MTRKDFELIARAIKNLSKDIRAEVANKFTEELKGTNSGFDPARFLKACGVES